MDFIEIAKKRYSVRSYMEQKVEPEKLEKIIEAAHVAPTAANQQPVHLLVVQSEEGLAKIGEGSDRRDAGADESFCDASEKSDLYRNHPCEKNPRTGRNTQGTFLCRAECDGDKTKYSFKRKVTGKVLIAGREIKNIV